MNINQLEVAIAVAETLSFSEAAYEMSFSLSAVSRMISSLEESLGVTLFFRKAKSKVSLTPAGEELLPYIRHIVGKHSQMMRAAQNIRKNSEETIVFSHPPNVPSYIEAELVYAYMKDRPDANVIEYRQNDARSVEMLYAGKLDFGISTLFGPIDRSPLFMKLAEDDNLISFTLSMSMAHLAVNTGHPLARKEQASLSELAEYEGLEIVFFSLFTEYAELMNSVFLDECEKQGFKPKTSVWKAQIASIPELISGYVEKNKNSVAFVQDILPRNKNCTKVRLINDNLRFTNFIYYLKTNNSKALKELVKAAKQIARKYNAVR